MSAKRGQKGKYEKGYFQGANMKDPSIFIKFPSHIEAKNAARKSKKKKRK